MNFKLNQRPIDPLDWNSYKAAALWLKDNDPIDTLDKLPPEAAATIREFATVYINFTSGEDYSGHYDPLGWAERAAFVYGYQMGKAAAEKTSII